jgi:hypothetical protein
MICDETASERPMVLALPQPYVGFLFRYCLYPERRGEDLGVIGRCVVDRSRRTACRLIALWQRSSTYTTRDPKELAKLVLLAGMSEVQERRSRC